MTAVRSRWGMVLRICVVTWMFGAGCSSLAVSPDPPMPTPGSVPVRTPHVTTTAAAGTPATTTAAPTPRSVRAPATSSTATTTTTTTTAASSTPGPATTGSARPTIPARVFVGESAAIDTALAQRMSSTWHLGCPVSLSALSYLRISYRGFDGLDHIGEMVVATIVAKQVISVFHRLFDAKYPIRRMTLVDDFGGNDDASMAADNTSGFNCRPITGGVGFSQHSYGQAIDVDPVENPYIGGGQVLPPAGSAYVGRPRSAGVIHQGDATVAAFASIGWSWGGDWSSPHDLQHFSANGR